MATTTRNYTQLTSTEAAKYMGVSIKTLQASRRTGLLLRFPAPPHRRIGHRTVIYDLNDLNEFISKLPKGTYSAETLTK